MLIKILFILLTYHPVYHLHNTNSDMFLINHLYIYTCIELERSHPLTGTRKAFGNLKYEWNQNFHIFFPKQTIASFQNRLIMSNLSFEYHQKLKSMCEYLQFLSFCKLNQSKIILMFRL